MSLTKRVFIGICLASSLLLASCGSGAAAKGYSIRKAEIEAQYSTRTVQHKGASYVRLPNDGKVIFYYKATYMVDFSVLGTSTYTDYFMWVVGDTSTQKAYFADYDLYYAYVTKGLMKGSVGTLK